MPKDQVIVDSDGSLVRYPDPYGDVTPERIREAEQIEQDILSHGAQIDVHYLHMGKLLAEFKEKEYFRERSFDSFREWANSPNLKGMGYRTAHNLLRIVNEALPILTKHDVMNQLPSVSTMVNLLPILSDENAEEKFIEAVGAVQELTVEDAKEKIKDIRGIGSTLEDVRPAIFKARVTRGNDFHRVQIYCSTGNDYYECGTLSIKIRDWSRWAERFSEHFIEYIN